MRKALKIIFIIVIVLAVLVFGLSAYVTQSVKSEIAGADTGSGDKAKRTVLYRMDTGI